MGLRTGGTRRGAIWSVADVTHERERQENVFQELQHAIDYLDHAPVGFFSAGSGFCRRFGSVSVTMSGLLGYFVDRNAS